MSTLSTGHLWLKLTVYTRYILMMSKVAVKAQEAKSQHNVDVYAQNVHT